MNSYSTWLKHHGIAGQKWGKRNGPPYPIPAGKHSVAEKKSIKQVGAGKKGDPKERRKKLEEEATNIYIKEKDQYFKDKNVDIKKMEKEREDIAVNVRRLQTKYEKAWDEENEEKMNKIGKEYRKAFDDYVAKDNTIFDLYEEFSEGHLDDIQEKIKKHIQDNYGDMTLQELGIPHGDVFALIKDDSPEGGEFHY